MRWHRNESRPEKRRVPIFVYADDGTPAPANTIFDTGELLIDKGDGHYVVGSGYGLTNTDRPLVVADDVVEAVDTGADTLQLTAHGLKTGDGPLRLTTTGTLPTGLATGTDYWVIEDDVDNIQLADALSDAINGVAIDLTAAGSGTHTLVDTADTKRLNAGLFMYEAAQADIDYLGSYFAIRIAKPGFEDSVTSVDLIDEQMQHAGGAAAGGASTITLDSSASSTNNLYQDAIIMLVGGTGRGQVNTIVSYVGGTKIATLARPWAVQPIAGTEYVIVPGPSGSSSAGVAAAVWATVLEGAHTAGDLIRGLIAAIPGTKDGYTSGTITAKSLNGAKTRWTWSTDETGIVVTPGDLT